MSNKYIPNNDSSINSMLKTLGLENLESLFKSIPSSLRTIKADDSTKQISEMDLISKFKAYQSMSVSTQDYTSFLGAGVYDHFVPSIIDAIVQREEFYTSYTPYQPEISQGTLQAIFEYQSAMCRLTDLEVSNASMYDGATALSEACRLSVANSKSNIVLLSELIHPEWIDVVKTALKPINAKVIIIPANQTGMIDVNSLKALLENYSPASIAIQSPNFLGIIENTQLIGNIVDSYKSLFICISDPISLGLLKTPGECKADIAVGDGQPLGSYASFGGPHFGYFCATNKLLRKLPGRIVGQTKDVDGNTGYVLTMQAREQHIRREKATSNICSNHSLNALRSIIYLSTVGKEGLYNIALDCANKAQYLKEKLLSTGYFTNKYSGPVFKEFVLKSKISLKVLNKELFNAKIIGGLDLFDINSNYKNCWLLAVTEKRTYEELDNFTAEVLRICKEKV